MLISVCMATYNGGNYIKLQIDSILNQKFTENKDVEMEIIISDDGSTDDTLTILMQFADARIKVFHHTEHTPHRYYNAAFASTSNFAYAMRQAQGDYIFLSDQDDVWYPWKIDKTLSALKQYGGVVGTAFDLGDGDLSPTGRVIYKMQPFFSLRYAHSLYGFSCGMDRKVLSYVFPMPNVPQHDTFIMLSAQCRGQLHYIDEVCAMHRWSGIHNVSGKYNPTPQWVRLFYRLKIWVIVLYRYYCSRVSILRNGKN